MTNNADNWDNANNDNNAFNKNNQNWILPLNERVRVVLSAYSRSPPIGRPDARRVRLNPSRSFRMWRM